MAKNYLETVFPNCEVRSPGDPGVSLSDLSPEEAVLQILKTAHAADARAFTELSLKGVLDLPVTALHQPFVYGNKRFIIMGYKTAKTKYPVIALQNGTTKMYKFGVEHVKRLLGLRQLILAPNTVTMPTPPTP